jgi:hypothetical protein
LMGVHFDRLSARVDWWNEKIDCGV